MTKKFRENFFILLISNLFTITLVGIIQLLFDNFRTSPDVLYGIIGAVTVSTLMMLLLQSDTSHIVINNNVGSAQNQPSSDNVDKIREEFRIASESKENDIMTAIKQYSYSILGPYLSDNDLESLVQNIKLFKVPDAIISPIVSDTSLSALDLRHYVWNIGERLAWSGQKRATFVKLCFPDEMKDWEIETIRRNLRQKGTKCVIDIDVPDKNKYEFHY